VRRRQITAEVKMTGLEVGEGEWGEGSRGRGGEEREEKGKKLQAAP
jgi:hypothetical protein